jgi:cobalt/nickel transport system ATP-binding protein
MTPILEVSDLSFGYTTDYQVFCSLNFTIRQAESVGLVGGNGAGKSTLLWCLLGLLKPRGGNIRLFGEKWNRRLLRRVGMVFQNPEDQLFMPTVSQDVQLSLFNQDVPARGIEHARQLLRQAELEQIAERPATQLSLGERKRAALVCALAHAPELLLMDEPTAELDGRARRRLIQALRESPVTRLIASHDLGFVESVTERVIILGEQGILAEGATGAILADEATLACAHLI